MAQIPLYDMATAQMPKAEKGRIPAGPRALDAQRSPWKNTMRPGIGRRIQGLHIPGEKQAPTAQPGRNLFDLSLPGQALGKVGATPGSLLDLSSLPQLAQARRSLLAISGRSTRGSL